MLNPPLEQQLLDGIEERNNVISAQYKRIEELEAALEEIMVELESYYDGAPDSPTRWMSRPLTTAQQALKEQP